MQSFDVAIVGGGPAGALLARQLGQTGGFGVALLEARDLGSAPGAGREKSCGGLLAPDAQRALAALDLALPAQVLAAPLCFSVRAVDLPTGLERWYSRSYINIQRPLWDRWLFGLAAQSGISAFDGCRVMNIGREADGWRLSCRTRGGALELRARMVVGADGAASMLRRNFFTGTMPAYVSLQESFSLTGHEKKPHMAAFFDPEITDYYAWVIPKNGEYLLGAALLPEGAQKKFDLLKARLAPLGYGQGQVLRREATIINRPGPAQLLAPRSGEGLFLLGEAAGLISPSSAEGLSLALTSARHLAEALAGNRGDPALAAVDYERRLHPLRLRLAAKLLKSGIIYSPCLRRAIMKSGLNSLKLWGKPFIPDD